MPADVNVTEKARQVQRRERGEAWDVLVPEEGWTVGRIVEDAIETTLDTLADPEVLAEIAGVLRGAEDEWVRRYADAEGAPPTRSEFQAAAVVEWLRRQA